MSNASDSKSESSSTETKGSESEAQEASGLLEPNPVLTDIATPEAPAPKPVTEAKPKAEAASTSAPASEEAFDEASPKKPSLALDEEAPDTLQKFLRDPDEVVRDIKNEVLREVDSREAKRALATERWQNFYKSNPQLEGHKELVELVRDRMLAEVRSEGKALSWEDGSKLLANRVQALIKSVKTEKIEVDTDAASKTAVVSSSGNSAPHAVTKPAKPISFVEQLKSKQARKGIA